MLKKLQKSKTEGFTIIEVMIVLAIAGLIILIVLLAVPALQRNGRNTAIKNDASALTAGISEFISNNEGQQPTAAASTINGSTITFDRPAGTPAEAKIQGSTTVSFTANPTQAGQIRVFFGQKCNGPNAFASTANTRSTAILYNVETSGGGIQPRCLDS